MPLGTRPLVPFFLLFLVLQAPALTVTMDDNYPPYSFRDDQGRHQGILVDLWQLWSEKTGEPVTLLPMTWASALVTMASGQADVLDTVFQTPGRSQVWDFGPPYASIKSAVFHRDGLVGISSFQDLKGYLVGVKAGDAAIDVLTRAGVLGFRMYPSYEALIEAAARGDVHVFCMDVPPAQHLLLSKRLSAQFRQSFVIGEDSFRRAVTKGNQGLLDLVNRGFARLTPDTVAAVESHWRGTPLPDAESGRVVAVIIVGAFAVTLLLTVVVFILRLQVKRRTGQLAGTEEKLRDSEERSRAVVEALPDLLFVLDAQGLVLECRAPAATDLYQDAQRFVGRLLTESFPPEVAQNVQARVTQVLATGGVAVMEQELDIRGRHRVFDARIVAMGNGRFLAIVRDVSAIRLAWQDDLHRNKLESLGVLAGGLAHDFNNSLAVIQGFVSLARVQLTNPEKALGSLDKAVQATRRAAGLTSQLRVLAKGSEVHRKLLSVRDLAEEAASFALVGSPCLLAIEASRGPWTVEADPDQLSQVFNNLVLNAVQAMPRGGTVTLVFQRTAEGRISISVVDEGPGIPDENLSRIFDPYFTTKPKGSGLGLSVVHAVVERHGGSLAVDSRLGRGTVFTVTLDAAEGTPTPDAVSPQVLDQPFRGQRVLLMEDEGDLRDLMVQVTTSLGLLPTACRNGTEAVAAFDTAAASDSPFSLVVSDLLVPGDMGGREMISVLRTRPGAFRALAVTGFSTERSSEDFQNQGFDVIVGKPFTVDELKTRIVELMKSPWKTAQKP
jgi:signal transduction histidine kinase